jgi:hypothetical protein
MHAYIGGGSVFGTLRIMPLPERRHKVSGEAGPGYAFGS